MKRLWKILTVLAFAMAVALSLASCSISFGCPDDIEHAPWVVIEEYDCGAQLGKKYCEDCGKESTPYIDYYAYGTHIEIDPSWEGYVAPKEATCTEEGKEGYATCPHCAETIYQSPERMFANCEYVEAQYKEATCTEDGNRIYSYCKYCNRTEDFDYIIPAKGHSLSNVEKEATCTEDGVTGQTYCHNCDSVIDEGTVIEAFGHDEYVYLEAVPVTCMRASYTACIKCRTCEITLQERVETAAPGHSVVYEGAKEPKCYEGGCTAKIYCDRCDFVFAESRPLESTGHTFVGLSCKDCELTATAGLNYVKNKNSVTITGIENFAGGELIIPAQIEGLNVIEIANGAFENNTAITSLLLTGEVKIIGSNAFNGCSALEKVELGDSVTLVGENAFSGCNEGIKIYVYDFSQTYSWDANYAGTTSSLLVYADRKDGMGLYESYLEASSGNKEFIDRYRSETTTTVDYIMMGQTSSQTTKNIVEMAGADFYIYDVANETQIWYYQGALYQIADGQKIKISNTEVYASTLFLSISADNYELVFEAIENMTYYRRADGTYYCAFTMNGAKMADFYAANLNIPEDQISVKSCLYEYSLDKNGAIVRMLGTAEIDLYSGTPYAAKCAYVIEVNQSEVGTLEAITAPGSGFVDYTSSTCTHPYSYREYVYGYSATCEKEGKHTSEWCSACLQTVSVGGAIPKEPHNMVDGVCTDCGHTENLSANLGMLDFVINEDGKTITVTGIGTYTGSTLELYSNYFEIKFRFELMKITAIAPGAFKDCDNLTSVIIYELDSIGFGALEGCDNISYLKIYSTKGFGENTNYAGYLFGAESEDENEEFIPEDIEIEID